MHKKITEYIGVLLLLLFVGVNLNTESCLAASAEIEISADNTEITVGEELFLYLTIDSETAFGDFEANLTYDADVLDYQGGASVITGGNGFLKISDMGVTDGTTNRKYTMKFTATEVGTSEISLKGRAMVYDYATSLEMPVSSNVLIMKVKAAETASSNTSLKTLKISPSQLTPAFDKNTFEYSVNVGYDTENLIINAVPEDEKSTVSITGNESLKEGENKVVVTVLAESGAIIEYSISVNREPAPLQVTPGGEVIDSGTSHGVFEIVRIDGETYAVYSGRYKLLEPASDVSIPQGYVKTKIIRSDISITAYAPENNPDSEFLLIYAMNELGDVGFYQYDKIEKTLQRYVPQSVFSSGEKDDTSTQDLIQSEEYKSNLSKAGILIALLSALSALLLVIIIRMFMKRKGYQDDLD